MAKKDTYGDPDIGRLCAAIQRARLVLRRPREERFEAVRQYVGRHWSEEGAKQPIPCNLISLYVQVVGRKLIANDPRFLASIWDRQLKPTVAAMQTWGNQRIQQIRLANTLQRCAIDALFSMGICKVHLATPEDAAMVGWNLKAGKPTAARVDLDDWVHDIEARDLSEAGFLGHRYRVPLRVVKQNKLFSKDRHNLSATDDRLFNMEGDERIDVLGRTFYSNSEEYDDFVDLWEIYMPQHRLVITLRDDQLGQAASVAAGDKSAKNDFYGKALRIQDWIGPDSGPYHFLGFLPVPGNLMPKGPIQDLMDLHLTCNNLLRKLSRQAQNQKDVVFVHGGADADGGRLVNANDGEVIRVDNPQHLVRTDWGGPNQQNFQLFVALKDLLSWLAGNLDIAGGLSPQSKTASQDQMLNMNSSANIADMQQKTVNFTSEVIRALCWYWHHDPLEVMKTTYNLPGNPDMSAPVETSPQERQQIRFEDMDLRIDPYSMQHQSPQERLQALNQLVMQVITPMAPILQQQGVVFDVKAYLKKIAHYMDMPDIEEIITLSEPQPEPQSSGESDTPKMPVETTRHYDRRSIGNSQNSKDKQLLQQLSGMKPATERNGQNVGA